MKKNILLVVIIGVALTILPQPISAQEVGDEEEIEFSIDDNASGGPSIGKGPILVPTLWQNGYLLDFHGTHADYVLRILDDTANVVYFAVVPSMQTQVWLPTTLSGTYRIELISGSLLFYGYITL